MPIIEVDHLTKEFRLGQLQSLLTLLQNTGRHLTGRPTVKRAPLKALDDVTFSIEAGEVVGVIGANGAGKSTLLKLLSNITNPTHGTVKVGGRIAPIIEVGAGFVGDFTGRENLYLNGMILGMSRREINRKFDEIVDFAELEEFIDTPVKRYSSGMQVKLAFSLASSVQAEILLVDEVLAVGDLAFQRKCFNRMEDLIKRHGRTVLLVSHNLRQVERLCTRTILLDHGQVLAEGDSTEICALFYAQNNKKILGYVNDKLSGATPREGSGEVHVLDVQILDQSGKPVDQIVTREPLRIRVRLKFERAFARPEIVVGTHTVDMLYLSAASTAAHQDRPDLEAGEHDIELLVPSYPLAAGIYLVRVSIFDQHHRLVLAVENLKTFSVVPEPNAGLADGYEGPLRILELPSRWVISGQPLAYDEHVESVDASDGRERPTSSSEIPPIRLFR